MKSVAAIQSSYIPWKGFFDIIHDVDLFIFYDDVQFTRRDWRTRNRIKTAHGTKWLTVPAGGDRDRLICEVPLPNDGWEKKHWASISQAYAKAPYFKKYRPLIEALYLGHGCESLSAFNQHVTRTIAREALGMNVEFRDSREFGAIGKKLDRLLDLVKRAEATAYVSCPSAKDYIDPRVFADAGIELSYKSYDGYPEYAQPHPPFEHAVSIVDLLFSVGPDAPYFIWGWRESRR
jgi:hypothetical protein